MPIPLSDVEQVAVFHDDVVGAESLSAKADAKNIGQGGPQYAVFDVNILHAAFGVFGRGPHVLAAIGRKNRAYTDWLQLMETRHQIMSFRQDLVGFGEPMDGMWDGFQRINTDTHSGGIVGLFRQGSKETERLVTIKHLDSNKVYTVSEAISGKKICQGTGQQLAQNGFRVKMSAIYSGQLFEVKQLN